jgi:hypothetical protein
VTRLIRVTRLPWQRRTWWKLSSAFGALLLVIASGCGEDTATGPGTAEPSAPVVTSAKDYAKATFSEPTNVDSRWLPLAPGTRWTWKGHAFDGDERISRKVIITVTDLTKVVDGVRTVVTYDQDFNDGQMEEAEIALFAQDDEGNVWLFGEYPEEYEDGEIVKTPSWIAGIERAKAGIAVKAAPQMGSPSYAEGWGPAVGWDDRAKTLEIGAETCVPVACYTDVLIVKEFSRTKPGAFQTKYYAPGIGNVRVGWGGPKEEEREELVLVGLEHLDADEMAALRRVVLDQEARGLRIDKAYSQTAPMESPTTGSQED